MLNSRIMFINLRLIKHITDVTSFVNKFCVYEWLCIDMRLGVAANPGEEVSDMSLQPFSFEEVVTLRISFGSCVNNE